MIIIHGHSDDLLEIEGSAALELSIPDGAATAVLSDGTELTMHYSPPGSDGIWRLRPVRYGTHFVRHDAGMDADADHSDRVTMRDGITWVELVTPAGTARHPLRSTP